MNIKETIKKWKLEAEDKLHVVDDFDNMRTLSCIESTFTGNEKDIDSYLYFIFSEFDNKFRSFLRLYSFGSNLLEVRERYNSILKEYEFFNIKLDSDIVDYIIKDNEKSKYAYKLINNSDFIRLSYLNTLLCIINNTSKDEELVVSLLMLVEDIEEDVKQSIIQDYKLTYLIGE